MRIGRRARERVRCGRCDCSGSGVWADDRWSCCGGSRVGIDLEDSSEAMMTLVFGFGSGEWRPEMGQYRDYRVVGRVYVD